MDSLHDFFPEVDPELLKQILDDPKLLVAVTRRSFLYFFLIFFHEYIACSFAPFHRQLIEIAQDDKLKRAVVVAFRSSAKSTMLNTAYTLWAIMGVQGKKHVVIASRTQRQAYDHLQQIAREVEKNELLKKYLGPFNEGSDRWSAGIRMIPNYDARITAVSAEQESIRGLREGPHRPDLIIVDDIEDSVSTNNRELRDKAYRWVTGELLMTGDTNTKAIFLGNFVHDDCILARLGKLMTEKKMDGVYLLIPLLDAEGNIAWLGKFPNLEAVDDYRKNFGDDVRWFREFLLKHVADEYQIIRPEDIQYYDHEAMGEFLRAETGGLLFTGIDPAISEKETADYTAMVTGHLLYDGDHGKVFILPNPVNERMPFYDLVQRAVAMQQSRPRPYHHFFVEAVQMQMAIVQMLERAGVPATAMSPRGSDKYARFRLASVYIKNGTVKFPKKGCEELIRQMVNFGLENHDDLLDALCYLILGVVESGDLTLQRVHWI